MSSAKTVGCGDEPVDKSLIKNDKESRIET